MPGDSSGSGSTATRKLLREWIAEWARLDELIKAEDPTPTGDTPTPSPGTNPDLDAWKQTRREFADKIVAAVQDRHQLWDFAVDVGFNEDILSARVVGYEDPADDGGTTSGAGEAIADDGQTGGGAGAGGAGGGGNTDPGTTRGQAKDNRLLGELGKEYRLVQLPSGQYVAEYVYKLNGEVVRVGIKLGKEDALSKFGLKASDAKQITKAQAKRIELIGWAGQLAQHIRKGDTSVFKALTRDLALRYEGNPILNNDEVMGLVIAQAMFGWDAETFENQLRNTAWYSETNEWQRDWVLGKSDKERDDEVQSSLQSVINHLENTWGQDWLGHVDGGMETAKRWAKQIASGKWGTPDKGFAFWAEKQFDTAKQVENTPAWFDWFKEQEAINADLNRPEIQAELLRSDAMNYLGQINGEPLIDRATIKQWAADLVSGTKSDADWQEFLRQQMRNLYPFFDENQSYVSQASPYKSAAESLFGTTLTWDDPLLKRIAGTDDQGALTGTAMSLHDFEQYIRDNDDRFWANPATESKGLGFLSELMFRTSGVR